MCDCQVVRAQVERRPSNLNIVTPKPVSKMQLSSFTFLHGKTSTHRSGLSGLFIPFAEFWVDRKDFKWTLDARVHVKTTCWQLFLLC